MRLCAVQQKYTLQLTIKINYQMTEIKVKKPSEMTAEEFEQYLNEDPQNVETNTEGYKHIPIAFLEADLRQCFEGRVQFHKTPNQMLFNAVDCDVIIRVFHPVHKEWQEHYGTGTVLIESITEGKYADTTKVVKVSDESLATHAAFAEGKKSAAKGMGKRFGSDLNREIAPGKVKAYDVIEKPKFDPNGKYTKKELLQFVQHKVLTVDQMNDYSAGKPVVIASAEMQQGVDSEEEEIQAMKDYTTVQKDPKIKTKKK